ncbi:MAG TPA: hypothetical protein VLN58_14260 [Verrucomicrobiae bacterium]|nr:hypothetical protein [Verrucomicrobiae bacterium]
MNEWHYFLWLCEQAAEFIVFPPFLICSAVLSIIVAALCIGFRPIKNGLWKGSYWLVFTQMLFYPAVLAVATLGASPMPRPPEPNKLASACTDILSWASLALAGFWIWRMKGLRWLAVSLVVLQQVLLYGPFLTAEMAITGRWL